MSRRVIDERDALRRTVARQDERIRELEARCDKAHAAKRMAEESELAAAQELDEVRSGRDALFARCEKAERLLDRYRSESRDMYWRAMNAASARDDALAERDTADQETSALAAHVERIKACFKSTSATLPSTWQAEMYGLFAQAPKASLGRIIAEHVDAGLGHAEALIEAGAAVEEAFAATRRLAEEPAE